MELQGFTTRLDLNGKQGIVGEWDSKRERYFVEIGQQEPYIRVKPENLEVYPRPKVDLTGATMSWTGDICWDYVDGKCKRGDRCNWPARSARTSSIQLADKTRRARAAAERWLRVGTQGALRHAAHALAPTGRAG